MKTVFIDVEPGDIGIFRVGVSARYLHRVRQITNRPIIEIFAVKPDKAAIEFLGNIDLELAAFETIISNLARAFALAIKSANMIKQVIGQLAAVIEIQTVFAVVQTNRCLRCAALGFSGLRNQVDHTARRVRSERRS